MFFFCIDKKELQESQVVERTTTSQDKATSTRELKWKGKRRLRIIRILNSIRLKCFKFKLS